MRELLSDSLVKKTIHRRDVPENYLGRFANIHPVLAKIYASRNIQSSFELEHSLVHLSPYDTLKGINEAVAVLAAAIEGQQRILIVGDFDCDGATSTAVALRALKMMGAADVQFLVPNRFEYGYGLTPEIVAVAAKSEPDVIVTVDNGIASIEGVAVAKQLGMRVVVTDHHLPGEKLPDADAIVNPNQSGCKFPSKNLAGVGVIFYVMLALRTALREAGWFERQNLSEPNLAQLLDLVALGTVADVVPLDHINRILVAQGLARIRKGQSCSGIKALLDVAGRQCQRVVATDMGFAVGPRLNAAGRLEDMSIGIHCLLADDPAQAQVIARELDQLNRERRAIESEMQDQAMEYLAAMHLDVDSMPTGLCLFQEDWHQGVIGILASRIKERFNRPVIAFAIADDKTIKGSARSVTGFHIRDGLDAIASRFPDLLSKFGGHAMAAGLSIKKDDFDDFMQAFNEEVQRHLSDDDLQGSISSDGELKADDLSMELAEVIRQGGPWGQGFPEPVFDGVFKVMDRRIVGGKHLKMILRPETGKKNITAIAFNTIDDNWATNVDYVKLAYKLDVNDFRGEQSLQLLVDYVEPVST